MCWLQNWDPSALSGIWQTSHCSLWPLMLIQLPGHTQASCWWQSGCAPANLFIMSRYVKGLHTSGLSKGNQGFSLTALWQAEVPEKKRSDAKIGATHCWWFAGITDSYGCHANMQQGRGLREGMNEIVSVPKHFQIPILEVAVPILWCVVSHFLSACLAPGMAIWTRTNTPSSHSLHGDLGQNCSAAKLLEFPCQVVLASNTPTAFARGKGPTPAVVGMPTVALAPWRLTSLWITCDSGWSS